MNSNHDAAPLEPAAARVVARLRLLVTELDGEERRVLATLLAPAVERAAASDREWTRTILADVLGDLRR